MVIADISELNLAKGDSILFPEGQDKLLHFRITMRPKEGIYRHVPALACPPTTRGGALPEPQTLMMKWYVMWS